MRNGAEVYLKRGAGKYSGKKAATSRAPRVLLRLVLVSIAVALVCSFTCEDPYKTNPDLVLLLANEGHYPFNPVVSSDGRLVYFLDDTSGRSGPPFDVGLQGDLRVFDFSDSTVRLLLSGRFYRLALSKDGLRLAVAVRNPAICRDSTLLLVLDAAASSIESLHVSHAETMWLPWGLEFSWDGRELIFDIWPDSADNTTYFYSIELEQDTVARLFLQLPWHQTGFDVFAEDSIYADSSAKCEPAVNPKYPRWVVFASKKVTWLSYRWMLHDRQNGTVESYGSGTRPLGKGFIGGPSWTPDGNGLLFVAGRRTGPSGQPYAQLELWLLKNAAEYLPDSR